jgi:hypothetical protein
MTRTRDDQEPAGEDSDTTLGGGESAFKLRREKADFTRKKEQEKERWWRRVMGAVAVIVLVGAGTGMGLYLTRTTPSAPQPPCVTCVWYGSHAFAGDDAAIRAAATAIEKENAAVRGRKAPYVSIMLLNPLTAAASSDVTPARMADQLRAAYLAQVTMNATNTLGVQLLLDDEGTSAEASERPAVSQLLTMEGTPGHVIAVAGLGVSTAQSAAAAATLAHDGMPMFGAVISSDEFNGDTFPGMAQVVPDVAEQVARLTTAIPAPRDAVLVYDQQTSDYYTSDLGTGFSKAFAKALTGIPQPFTPSGADTNIQFKAIADEVCYTSGPPPVVFYAGRASVLASLIQHFQGDGNCQDKKITMVTAADADGLAPTATVSPPGDGQVSVVYTDVLDLNRLTPAFRQSYERALGALDPGATGLSDVWTAATYNAMMAAWTAIQAAYQATAPNIPTKADVRDFADRLNGEFATQGAVGPFSLGPDGTLLSPDIPVFEDSGGKRTNYQAAS